MDIRQGWLHGTDTRFEEWQIPPPQSVSKPELHLHTAAFLTKDRELARHSSGGRYLCVADLKPTARLINVLEPGADSEAMRRVVANGALGQYHDYAKLPEWWTEAWQQGEMMRFGTTDPELLADINTTQKLAMRAKAGDVTTQTMQALLKAQNLTRRWIEELVLAARGLGFDALIGREVDTYRTGGAVACDVVFALTNDALERPRWISLR